MKEGGGGRWRGRSFWNEECRMMNAEFFYHREHEVHAGKLFKNSVFSVRSVVKSFSDQENRLALAETFLVLRGMSSVRFG